MRFFSPGEKPVLDHPWGFKKPGFRPHRTARHEQEQSTAHRTEKIGAEERREQQKERGKLTHCMGDEDEGKNTISSSSPSSSSSLEGKKTGERADQGGGEGGEGRSETRGEDWKEIEKKEGENNNNARDFKRSFHSRRKRRPEGNDTFTSTHSPSKQIIICSLICFQLHSRMLRKTKE